jgi:hypothetical protein
MSVSEHQRVPSHPLGPLLKLDLEFLFERSYLVAFQMLFPFLDEQGHPSQ